MLGYAHLDYHQVVSTLDKAAIDQPGVQVGLCYVRNRGTPDIKG
jgi:hypothetical protein